MGLGNEFWPTTCVLSRVAQILRSAPTCGPLRVDSHVARHQLARASTHWPVGSLCQFFLLPRNELRENSRHYRKRERPSPLSKSGPRGIKGALPWPVPALPSSRASSLSPETHHRRQCCVRRKGEIRHRRPSAALQPWPCGSTGELRLVVPLVRNHLGRAEDVRPFLNCSPTPWSPGRSAVRRGLDICATNPRCDYLLTTRCPSLSVLRIVVLGLVLVGARAWSTVHGAAVCSGQRHRVVCPRGSGSVNRWIQWDGPD